MSDLMSIAGFLVLVLLPAYAFASWAFDCDWKKRSQHQCGHIPPQMFAHHDRNTICPRCGGVGNWTQRTCRKVFPFIWQFKDTTHESD